MISLVSLLFDLQLQAVVDISSYIHCSQQHRKLTAKSYSLSESLSKYNKTESCQYYEVPQSV